MDLLKAFETVVRAQMARNEKTAVVCQKLDELRKAREEECAAMEAEQKAVEDFTKLLEKFSIV